MKTYNHTTFSIDEIERFELLVTVHSSWRQRVIHVRRHPTEPDQAVSVGVTFDGTMMVISQEPMSAWQSQIDSAVDGFVQTG